MPCSILSVLPTLDSEPKRYQNSGLRKDLKKNSKVEETFDPFQSGGLDDEDASSTRPAFPRTQRSRPHVRSEPEAKDLKRDQSRKNNVSYRFIFSLYLSFSHCIFHFLIVSFIFSLYLSFSHCIFHLTATLNQFVQIECQESGDDAGPTKKKVKVHTLHLNSSLSSILYSDL